MIMKRLQNAFEISDEATLGLRKGIVACTLTNIVTLLSVLIVVLAFQEVLKPLTGAEASWPRLWILFFVGLAIAIISYIAHRLSTIRNADSILVVERGSIVERGTFEQLITAKGQFGNLWECYTHSTAWKLRGGETA